MQTGKVDQAGQQDQTADTAREKIPAFVRLRYFRPSRSNGQEAGKPCAVYVCGGCSWCRSSCRKVLYRGDLDRGVVITSAGDIDFDVRL